MSVQDAKILIQQCRFFNGEKTEPDWLNQNERMFWSYERYWVEGRDNPKIYSGYLSQQPDMNDFEVGDGTPQGLKALLCDRYSHFCGTDQGFKEFYRSKYQVRLTNKQREDNAWKLRHCRIYNGNGANDYEFFLSKSFSFREPSCGYKKRKSEEEIKEILSIFYLSEKIWVVKDSNRQISGNKHIINQYNYDIGDDLDGDKVIPKELKVILYYNFLNCVDGLYNRFCTAYETNLFKKYYVDLYQPLLTPNQKRDKERRDILLPKCRYFQGEAENPWEYCYSPVLEYRKKMWMLEKDWVEAMVKSYNCPQSSKELLKTFVLEEFFKSRGMALSLVNLVVSEEKKKADAENIYFGPAEAIKVIEEYEKKAPLGRDHRMYFAYYLGENESPYKNDPDAEEYLRMGWSQERLQIKKSISMCDFESRSFQRQNRGKEGIWGWYADPKFPKAQKDLLYFMICNWGIWCPYCDEDKLAEQYLNYHYPGDSCR